MAFDLLYPHSSRRRNLIDLRGTVAFRGGRLIVNTPKSGKLRTVDTPGSLIAALRDRYSIRQAEAAVAGGEPSPWVFPSATDPTKPLNDAWLRDRVWRPAGYGTCAFTTPAIPMPR